jgi:di/tricarboxylate transporter
MPLKAASLTQLKLVAGPALGLVTGLAVWASGTSGKMGKMFFVLIWMVTWWLNGAVQMGVTGLLPIVLLPLLGIGSATEVSSR